MKTIVMTEFTGGRIVFANGNFWYEADKPCGAYCSSTSDNRVNGASCAYKAFTGKDYFKNLPK